MKSQSLGKCCARRRLPSDPLLWPIHFITTSVFVTDSVINRAGQPRHSTPGSIASLILRLTGIDLASAPCEAQPPQPSRHATTRAVPAAKPTGAQACFAGFSVHNTTGGQCSTTRTRQPDRHTHRQTSGCTSSSPWMTRPAC